MELAQDGKLPEERGQVTVVQARDCGAAFWAGQRRPMPGCLGAIRSRSSRRKISRPRVGAAACRGSFFGFLSPARLTCRKLLAMSTSASSIITPAAPVRYCNDRGTGSPLTASEIGSMF